ncbi:hypothetical protein [Cognatishimia activa]|uniref:hypothetical protein n=1 Tax=Cognatishimia activa TaxID=1715691 RepID=UPI00071CF7F4|nr:hypothetical protein [Cognatishimia activa]
MKISFRRSAASLLIHERRKIIVYMLFVTPNLRIVAVWTIAALLVCAGVIWAIRSGDGANFARAGSLLVIIASIDYLERPAKLKARFEDYVDKSINFSIHLPSSYRDAEPRDIVRLQNIGERLGDAVNRFGLHIANIDFDKTETYYRRSSLVMAWLGTLIWGFGDLLPFGVHYSEQLNLN